MINLIGAVVFTYLAYRKWEVIGADVTESAPDFFYYVGYCFVAGLFWGGVINWIL